MQNNSIGSFTATMNGERWQSSYASFLHLAANGRISIRAQVLINGIGAQALTFTTLDRSTGKQGVSTYAHYWDRGNSASEDSCYAAFYVEDGDISYETYYGVTDSSADNHVNIHTFNPVTGELRGAFQLDLMRDDRVSPVNTPLPDTLHFRDGSFNLKLPI